tara:strand:+ start:4122 stop:6806 length:2685 start_codon:yes stop_codon:yes gene_type:complete
LVDKNSKKFVLIDGSSYLYRAFYAMPHLKNSKDEHTGALFGVCNMVYRLLNEYNPDYLCMIFDARGKNFRHHISSDYKSNRSSMPEELSQQVDPIMKFITSLGIKILQVPDVEADDVIATLTIQNYKNIQIIISSGDKDLAQLVNDKVILVNSMNNKILDIKGVEEKFGVSPDKIVDYLALVGDTSDNIAGVDLIGPKKASALIKQYGDIDSILNNLDNISGKVRENLDSSRKGIALAKKLVKLKTDVNINLDIDNYVILDRDEKLLAEIVEKYELKNIADNYQIKSTKKTLNKEVNYKIISTQVEFDSLLKKLLKKKIFSFDTETSSIDPISAELIGMSFSADESEAYYIPINHCDKNGNINFDKDYLYLELKKLFENKTLTVIGQNIKYDINVLAKYNINFNCMLEDTMLLSYVINSSGKHDLNSLANKHLSYDCIKYEDVVGSGVKQKIFSEVAVKDAAKYSCEDADITLKLYVYLLQKILTNETSYKLYKNIEIPLISVISLVEQNGVMIDTKKLNKQSKDLTKRIKIIEAEVYNLAGKTFNIGSPKQIQEIFYNDLKLPVLKKTPKGQPSTNEDVMSDLSQLHELPKLILQFRNLMKLKNTYTDRLGEQVNGRTKRLHTSYNQTVTITGRLSSSNPNLQNIPIKNQDGKNIRKTFITKKGYQILSADYSQIELRVMAHLSNDKALIEGFLNNEDIHASTAKEIFSLNKKPTEEQRRSAKAINFGLIYGISSYGLSKQLKIDNNSAKEYIEKYFEKYTGIREFMDDTKKSAKEKGFVSTISGRKIYVPNITHNNFQIRSAAERTAINAPIQGTAADILKISMIDIHNWIVEKQLPLKIIMQVHDELVFEVKDDFLDEAKKQIISFMSNSMKIKVPLIVDIGTGDNWEKAH